MKSLVIAVDFDGTCVSHEYPKVGRDIGAAPVLRELVAAGHKLVLWTMRSGDTLRDAEVWFVINEIPLWCINDNPLQRGWSKSPKLYASIYIDDAAIACPLHRGLRGERPFVDWDAVRILLVKRGAIPGTLDEYFPPRGECGLCGGPDARHRLFDAILDRLECGESEDSLADDYGVCVAAIEMVRDQRPLRNVGGGCGHG